MIGRTFDQGDTIEVLNKPWDNEQLKGILRELLAQQEHGGGVPSGCRRSSAGPGSYRWCPRLTARSAP